MITLPGSHSDYLNVSRFLWSCASPLRVVWSCASPLRFVWSCASPLRVVWSCASPLRVVWSCASPLRFVWSCASLLRVVWPCASPLRVVWSCASPLRFVWPCASPLRVVWPCASPLRVLWSCASLLRVVLFDLFNVFLIFHFGCRFVVNLVHSLSLLHAQLRPCISVSGCCYFIYLHLLSNQSLFSILFVYNIACIYLVAVVTTGIHAQISNPKYISTYLIGTHARTYVSYATPSRRFLLFRRFLGVPMKDSEQQRNGMRVFYDCSKICLTSPIIFAYVAPSGYMTSN